MSGLLEAELAATCSSLGGLHGGKYVVEPQCFESVRDIIRYLRRDDEYHAVRRYLGQANILQTDLVHIAAISSGELFDIVIRLMVNLTNPVLLLYKEELPAEKVGRNIYMSLLAFTQEYKLAFCNVEFWTVVCKKLTELFEVDWADRSEDQSLQVERLLVLLRNVLQVPADTEAEKRPDNDVTVHDKVLWALRESQLLELLLYVSSNKDEEKYYLHLLEVFSLLLREQSPGLLATCEIRRSAIEKEKDAKDLLLLREKEKINSRSFKNTRTFSPTFVVKNVKSISDKEVVIHKSLDKLNDLKLTHSKKRLKTPKNKCPVDSERPERRSTFSVRLFLKEFCLELLSCSFNNIMSVVKYKLASGRGLANDESYYFWALKFFLEFACSANIDVKLISECINVETFHFAQTQIENCFDHLTTDKKKMATWVKRLHLILKAYRSLLQTLQWMDSSKDPKIRESSKQLKSSIFYVVEYRELLVDCLLKYDSAKFPLSFLRDLIETNHLSLKLLEAFCKSNKIVVQKKKRVVKRSKQKKKKETPRVETAEDQWSKINEEIFSLISNKFEFPEIPPFDAASGTPIDDQREDAMRNIQRFLRSGSIKEAVGLLRSARQVWPENDVFGSDVMSAEDEVMALQEICVTDLGVVYENSMAVEEEDEEMDSDEDEDETNRVQIVEQGFDIQDYIKKLVSRRVVEGCCILLANYKRNLASTNHCVAKLLHRIAYDCKSPSMLYQASLFIVLKNILLERDPEYKELQQFAKYLIKKFRENAVKNPKILMEILFWKDVKVAFDIENGYGTSEHKDGKPGVWLEEEEDELRRLWVEFEQKMLDGDVIDWIQSNLINQSRSRVGIIKKLKELMLIAPGAKIGKKRRGMKDWTELETSQLMELYQEFKEAVDVAQMIKDRLPFTRTKKSIKDKLVEIGAVNSLADLRKKKTRNGKKSLDHRSADISGDESSDKSSSESESEAEPMPEVTSFVAHEAIDALRSVEHMTDALEWLKETYEESIEEEDCDNEGYPLLALGAKHSEALENEDFKNVLRKLGLKEPLGEQVYWKIHASSKLELHERLELINAALNHTLDQVEVVKTSTGNDKNEDSGSEDEFEKLRKSMPYVSQPEIRSSPQSVMSESQSRKVRRLSDSSDSRSDFDKLSAVSSVSPVKSGSKKADSASHSKSRSSGVASDSDESDSGDKQLTSEVVESGNGLNGSDKSDGDLRLNTKTSVKNGTESTGLSKSSRNRIRRVAIESDESDTGDNQLTSEPVSTNHPIDSDRSEDGNGSDRENRPPDVVSKVTRRPAVFASDSEGEEVATVDPWRQKRRRCIGSDSEVEERPSDDEGGDRVFEVRKKTKIFDSDSEGGGSGAS